MLEVTGLLISRHMYYAQLPCSTEYCDDKPTPGLILLLNNRTVYMYLRQPVG